MNICAGWYLIFGRSWVRIFLCFPIMDVDDVGSGSVHLVQEVQLMTRTMIGLLCLLVGLVATRPAYAYPSAVVSSGINPVRSAAGLQDFDTGFSRSSVISAPPDQDLVLTDIILGCVIENDDARFSASIKLIGSDGVTYGVYAMQSGRLYDSATTRASNFAGQTGVRIPAGVSLSIQWTFGYQSHANFYYSGTYTLSGYLANP